jgi:hypothetical protein
MSRPPLDLNDALALANAEPSFQVDQLARAKMRGRLLMRMHGLMMLHFEQAEGGDALLAEQALDIAAKYAAISEVYKG